MNDIENHMVIGDYYDDDRTPEPYDDSDAEVDRILQQEMEERRRNTMRTDLEEAISILVRAQSNLDDWFGPAGTKLGHASTYLRMQLYPMIDELLAEPKQG